MKTIIYCAGDSRLFPTPAPRIMRLLYKGVFGCAICARLFFILLLISAPYAYAHEASRPDVAAIERITGIKGSFDEKEGVFKVSLPRTDLEVSAAGVRITPPMGLTSWAAFKKFEMGAIVMGDMVLTEGQITPVMNSALENGLNVTALHNHFLLETPRVMFMHIEAAGDESALAEALKKVFDKIKGTGKAAVSPKAHIEPADTSLDTQSIRKITGVEGGILSNGVYKITVGRTAEVMGAWVGGAMGVSTWAAFAGSDEEAVVDGDFVCTEEELQDVLKSLLGSGINVTAIHNHMVMEDPRLIFIHYWGTGPAQDLSKGVKAALDAQKKISDRTE